MWNLLCSEICSPQTAVIPEEDRLFFLNFCGTTIEVANLNGTGRNILFAYPPGALLRGLAVDPVAK